MEERIKRERSEERIEVLLGTVKSLMENMQLSAQQVMAAMNISEEDKQKLIKKYNMNKITKNDIKTL